MFKNQREALQTITEFTAAAKPAAAVKGVTLTRIGNSTAIAVDLGKETIEVGSRVSDIDLLGQYASALAAPSKKAKAKK